MKLVAAFGLSGRLDPKPAGGRRHAKLERHRGFLLAQVSEKEDITMPELAAAVEAATGTKADPASLSRWLIRNGYRFKKKRCWPASKIAPRSARRAKTGKNTASRGCGLSRIG